MKFSDIYFLIFENGATNQKITNISDGMEYHCGVGHMPFVFLIPPPQRCRKKKSFLKSESIQPRTSLGNVNKKRVL